jgi:general secretion pathway protein J
VSAGSIRRARREAGFSLLELLVAMTILALVSMLAVGGLRVIADGWRERRGDAARVAVQARGAELVREELSRSLPLDWGEAGRFRVAFDGDEEGVRFVTASPAYRRGRGLIMWEYGIEAGPTSARLVARRLPVPEDGAGFEMLEAVDPTVVLELPPGVRLEYLGREGEEAQAAWAGRWREAARLPMAVRLIVDQAEVLRVPLHIDTPAECAVAEGGPPEVCGS